MRESIYSGIDFNEFMYSCFGVTLNPKMDGAIHRFSTTGKRGDLDGWYVYYSNPDGKDVCVANSWRYSGDNLIWAHGEGNITSEYREYIRRKAEEGVTEKKAEEEKAAAEAVIEYSLFEPSDGSHPYLQAKGVKAYEGVSVSRDGSTLYIPLFSSDGSLSSYQRIFPDEGGFTKRFKKGGRTKGCFFTIGHPVEGDEVWMCEGYATGASIYEATGKPVIVAFSSKNLISVAAVLKERYRITIVADNDSLKKNSGEEDARKSGLPYILIPEAGKDANDYAAEHGLEALKNLLIPQSSTWIEDGDELLKTPSPLRWLIKGWIPRDGLAMVFGASNSGKTFVVLDMLLSMSTGRGSWMGMKARNANCLYLCGEGFAGLRGRVALWAQEHGLSSVGTFKISKGPKRLNEASDLAFVAEQIDLSGMQPDIIAIDTLNRFFSGDENSAEEISGFLESLMELQNKYKCAILLIHHTGVSKEADMRARGSSALNAAADVAICVTNEKGYLTLTQTKQKDAELQEPVEVHLKGAVINGWLDEDGEEVRSAIIEPVGVEGKQVDITEEMMIISDAWLRSEHKMRLGYPALSSSDLRNYMRDVLAWSRNKIKKVFANDYGSRFLRKMLSAGVIQMVEEQILMVDEVSVSCCLLTLSGMEKQGGANGANVVPKTFWHQ